MNTKIKLWFNKPIAKKVLVILSLIFLAFLIIAPITLIFTTNNFNQIYAYNRDTNSGTYEAFNEKVLDADGYQEENNLDKSPKNSYNVMEVSSNDRMISNVSRNKNTIGYVSIGTIGSFDEDGIFIKDEQYSDFDVLNFSTTTDENGVDIVIEPTYENIVDETYEPTRSFNEFFRVPNPNSSKRTDESEILLLTPQQSTDASNSYWNTSEVDGDILISLSNEEKLSFAYYEWILYSQTAADIIKEEGEIIQQDRPNLLEPNEAKVAGNQLYEILYGIPLNLSELTPDDHEVINIEQVGSTSVQSLITTFEATLNPKLDPYNIKITHNQSGSGSASSLGAPAGSTNPYIGFQSREATGTPDTSDFEYKDWGYENNDELEIAYNSIAIDAIAIIANNKKSLHTEDYDITYVTQDQMQEIYFDKIAIEWSEIALEQGLI